MGCPSLGDSQVAEISLEKSSSYDDIIPSKDIWDDTGAWAHFFLKPPYFSQAGCMPLKGRSCCYW